MQLCNNNKAEAARRLGISEKSIYNKLKRYSPPNPDLNLNFSFNLDLNLNRALPRNLALTMASRRYLAWDGGRRRSTLRNDGLRMPGYNMADVILILPLLRSAGALEGGPCRAWRCGMRLLCCRGRVAPTGLEWRSRRTKSAPTCGPWSSLRPGTVEISLSSGRCGMVDVPGRDVR
ncbi:hypothetical protein HS125_13710 [bacterium]|nr:hypothetical protein [bacterium]